MTPELGVSIAELGLCPKILAEMQAEITECQAYMDAIKRMEERKKGMERLERLMQAYAAKQTKHFLSI